jgi:NADH-quinone oxidoreductase subunit L
MLTSTAVVLIGLFLGWWLYSRTPIAAADSPDILDTAAPAAFTFLGHAYYIDALYAATVVRLNSAFATLSDLFDRFLFGGVIQLVSYATLGAAWFDSLFDSYFINLGFDAGTHTVSLGGRIFSRLQTGRVQTYLRLVGFALVVLVLYLLWGATA